LIAAFGDGGEAKAIGALIPNNAATPRQDDKTFLIIRVISPANLLRPLLASSFLTALGGVRWQ
jgi:hypothetical protein